jgi:hypothetical protein
VQPGGKFGTVEAGSDPRNGAYFGEDPADELTARIAVLVLSGTAQFQSPLPGVRVGAGAKQLNGLVAKIASSRLAVAYDTNVEHAGGV